MRATRFGTSRRRNTSQSLLVFLIGLAALLIQGLAADEKMDVLKEGFEGGRERWQPAAVGGVDSQHRHGGQTSLKISDGDTNKYFTTECRIPVKPNAAYELSFQCYTEDSRTATLCVIQYDDKGEPATFEGVRLSRHCFPFSGDRPLGQWRLTTYRFVTGPHTVACGLRLNPADASKTHKGTVWFDDITLTYLGPKEMSLDKLKILPKIPRGPKAEDSLPLKPLTPLKLNLASPDCTILCPKDRGRMCSPEAARGRALSAPV